MPSHPSGSSIIHFHQGFGRAEAAEFGLSACAFSLKTRGLGFLSAPGKPGRRCPARWEAEPVTKGCQRRHFKRTRAGQSVSGAAALIRSPEQTDIVKTFTALPYYTLVKTVENIVEVLSPVLICQSFRKRESCYPVWTVNLPLPSSRLESRGLLVEASVWKESKR